MTVPASDPGIARFRTKLLLAIMLVVTSATALGLYLAHRNLSANARRDLERQFQDELALLHTVQDVRNAAVAERCRTLAHKPRLHAALEDNALDLLYPSARDELLDVLGGRDADAQDTTLSANAVFYRFLDADGAVIPPPPAEEVGSLQPEEVRALALKSLPTRPQTGYFWRGNPAGGEALNEVIAMPILSSQTGLPIAALELGLKPPEFPETRHDAQIKSGIWTAGKLSMPGLEPSTRALLIGHLERERSGADGAGHTFTLTLDGEPSLVIYTLLNEGSVFPPAFEVCVYSLTESVERERRLSWQVVAIGAILLVAAFLASNVISWRFSEPVKQLAAHSEENRHERDRMAVQLEVSHGELQRSARFSADASHQLKTPVTVLRAGLEELLAGEELSNAAREEVSALVHQTFRLTGVIEDLLLLSRMDAGRLHLTLTPVDLIPLVEAWLDDFGALPEAFALEVATDFAGAAFVQGEKGYTSIIVQNLLENAGKYNRPGGQVRVALRREGPATWLTVGNTGPGIPAETQAHLFERFHRGSVGEYNPGHGLGLNLARELARLHQGDLVLVRSDETWTEFQVRFVTAEASA